MKKITVLGSFNMDLTCNTKKFPLPGESVIGSNFAINVGGKGANQAIAAAKAGGDVAFITKIGMDEFGEKTDKVLSELGVKNAKILKDENEKTGVALIMVNSESGENSIVVAPGASLNLKAEEIEIFSEDIINADVFLTQLETSMEPVIKAVEKAFDAGVKTILNPAPFRELPGELYSKLWCITPNETEAKMLTGIDVCDIDGVKKAADVLIKRGVKNVIITLGKRGVYLKNETEEKIIPAFKAEKAVDTTGAGDCFNGAFAYAVSCGLDIEKACIFGNAAASISVSRKGAGVSMPDAKEIYEVSNINI